MQGPEIVVGLIGAVGTDLKNIEELLTRKFSEVNYTAHTVGMSGLLLSCYEHANCLANTNGQEDRRIEALMTAGDNLRKKAERGDAVVLLAIGKIKEIRLGVTEEKDKPLQRVAYILNSLKHPDEVKLLREIYGEAFLAVSVYTPKSMRCRALCERISKSHDTYHPEHFVDHAEQLISRDEKAVGQDFGQNVQDTFPEADVFLECGNPSNDVGAQISRAVDILFQHPNRTPTVDEYGLFHARAAALRSADLSRQVGAVITTTEGEIIAAGCNEVPKAGGGAFWECTDETDQDHRDFKVGFDSSARMKRELIDEVFERLKAAKWLSKEKLKVSPADLTNEALFDDNAVFSGTRITSIIEFGRIVHAEMSAITEAARRGLATKDATLYCTTFPCHMCARHIIAAGIRRVVYVEPYPKSMAKDLYKGSLDVDHDNEADVNAVRFRPFVGVSPKRYPTFFDMPKRKDKVGYALHWKPREAEPRLRIFPTYLASETIMLQILAENRVKWEISK